MEAGAEMSAAVLPICGNSRSLYLDRENFAAS